MTKAHGSQMDQKVMGVMMGLQEAWGDPEQYTFSQYNRMAELLGVLTPLFIISTFADGSPSDRQFLTKINDVMEKLY